MNAIDYDKLTFSKYRTGSYYSPEVTNEYQQIRISDHASAQKGYDIGGVRVQGGSFGLGDKHTINGVDFYVDFVSIQTNEIKQKYVRPDGKEGIIYKSIEIPTNFVFPQGYAQRNYNKIKDKINEYFNIRKELGL